MTRRKDVTARIIGTVKDAMGFPVLNHGQKVIVLVEMQNTSFIQYGKDAETMVISNYHLEFDK